MRLCLGVVAALLCLGLCRLGMANGSLRDAGVEVALSEPPLPQRHVTLEWDPTALILQKNRGNLVIMPIRHHALVLSGFYANVTTPPIAITFDTSDNGQSFAIEQNFKGGGGEIGYRYYTGFAGPQGFFVGPSFVYSQFHRTGGDASSEDVANRGVALDIGCAALVAQRVSFSLSGGVQWTATSVSLPTEFFPADWLVNEGWRARFALSVGVAL